MGIWRFYLLAVVQSLWLDLSHSTSENLTSVRGPLSSPLLSDAGLEALLRNQKQAQYSSLRQGQPTSPDTFYSRLSNDFWNEISTTDLFKKSAQVTLMKIFTELQSNDYSSISPVSISSPRDPPHPKASHPGVSAPTVSVNAPDNNKKCVQLQTEKGSLELCLLPPTCADFSLKDFPSEYSPPTSLYMAIHDLSISCSADWTMTYTVHVKDHKRPLSFEYEGTAGFTLSQFSSSVLLNLMPGFSKVMEDIPIPTSLKFDACQVNSSSLAFEVFFSGGAIGQVLDKVLSPVLNQGFLNSVNWLLCDVLAPLLGRAVTRVLKNSVDGKIDTVMGLGVPLPPVLRSGYHSWSTSVLNTVHKLVDMLHVNEASLLKCFVRESRGLLEEEREGIAGRHDDDFSPFPQFSLSSSHFTPVKTHSSLINVLMKLQVLLESAIKDMASTTFSTNINNSLQRFTPTPPGLTIDIISVSVDGFKTLSNLELLYPSIESNITLQSTLTFASLDLEIDVSVLKLDPNGEEEQEPRRDMRVTIQLKDVTLDIDMIVALSSSILDHLYLDEVTQLPCLLSALEQVTLSNLLVKVDVMDLTIHVLNSTKATISDDMNDNCDGEDLNMVVNNMFELLLKGYPAMTSQLVTGLFQGPVRESLNTKISETRNEFHNQFPAFLCVSHVTSNTSVYDWITWSNSTLVQGLNNLMNELVGPSGVNSILSCLTDDSNEVLVNVPLTAPIFAGWNITISGLNSFYEFALLAAEDQSPYDLLTDIALGGECNTAVATASESFVFPFDGSGSEQQISIASSRPDPMSRCIPLNITIKGYEHNQNYVDVKLRVKDFRFLLDLLIKMDHAALSNMQVSTFHTQGCIANAINTLQIDSWGLHASDVEFFFVDETEEISLTKLANSIFDMLVSANNRDTLNSYLDSSLLNAGEVCSAGGVTPSSSDISNPKDHKNNQFDSVMHFFRHTWKWKVVVLIVGTLASFCLLLRMYYRKAVQLDKSVGDYHVISMKETKHDILTYPPMCSGNLDPYIVHVNNDIESSQEMGIERRKFLSNQWIQFYLQKVNCYRSSDKESLENGEAVMQQYDSLLGNETMSLFTRVSVVFFICFIMYIFVISEIPSSPAALVIMEIDVGNQVSPPLTVFKFGLAETIREMWRAKVYYLAILIAFFTAAWPYIKMVAMLLAWVLPTSVLSVAWRNSLLVWLDVLGKWSLVDSFVMMVMMVGFNFSFDIIPGVDVRVTVNPQWGFYAFLLATAASLAIGHFVLACHRLCCAVAEKEEEERKFLYAMRTDEDVIEDLKQSASEGFFLEVEDHTNEKSGALDVDTDCEVDVDLEKKIPMHLYAQWGDKDIIKCADEIECEALMDHVFTVEIINMNSDVASTLSSSCVENEDNDLLAPLVSQSSTSTIVHLADLAEWTFPTDPSPEPSYLVTVAFTPTGKLCMVTLFGLSTLMVLGGTFVSVIEFDFIGLTGYLMDEPVTSYSLVDIGLKIPVASGDPHSFGVLFIQIIYFVFGICMPLVFFILVTGLFICPFSLPTFRGVVVLTEVLNAWAALDVLVVSAVASVMEIRRFAQFMLGESCSEMNLILEATMDERLEGNDSCFDVIASMKEVRRHLFTICMNIIVHTRCTARCIFFFTLSA